MEISDRYSVEFLSKKMVEAAGEGNFLAVQNFLRIGADVHFEHEEALREAALHGHKTTVEYLLRWGNADFWAALSYATLRGSLTTTKNLIEYSAPLKGQSIRTLRDAFSQVGDLDISPNTFAPLHEKSLPKGPAITYPTITVTPRR